MFQAILIDLPDVFAARSSPKSLGLPLELLIKRFVCYCVFSRSLCNEYTWRLYFSPNQLPVYRPVSLLSASCIYMFYWFWRTYNVSVFHCISQESLPGGQTAIMYVLIHCNITSNCECGYVWTPTNGKGICLGSSQSKLGLLIICFSFQINLFVFLGGCCFSVQWYHIN